MVGTQIEFDGRSVTGLGRINVLLGKNGSGKSTLLRRLEELVSNKTQLTAFWQDAKYVTPERSGTLTYDPNVDSYIASDPNWIFGARRANQSNNFKQQTISQYRQLELNVLRGVEAASMDDKKPDAYFTVFLNRINDLLDNIEIQRNPKSQTFKLLSREDGTEIRPNHISSGESELIALAIEGLSFVESIEPGERGLLLFDEPDVHLHPDLQARLVRFTVDLLAVYEIDIIIATHSTAILGELSLNADARVCFQSPKQLTLDFEAIDSVFKELLPVFGAHPLTQIFNKTRTLLVEGDDDVRIWQEAVRVTDGALKLTPIGCGGTPNIPKYEKRMAQIVSAVYENGRAYSLRDGDGATEELSDEGPITKMRTRCYATENLLLSDDVLASAGIDWEQAKARIVAWCDAPINQNHDHLDAMKKFVDEGFDRKNKKIKAIRMLLLAQVLESNLPWEVLVGKVIGKLDENSDTGPDNIRTYLGQKAVKELLGIS